MDTDSVKTEYEITFLVREEADAKVVAEALAKHKAEVKSEAPLKRILLAYKIKKQLQAYFGAVRFMAEPAMADSLTKMLRTNPTVLRFLMIKPPSIKATTATVRQPRPGLGLPPRAAEGRPMSERPAPAPALSNEELGKKIEEILQ